MALGCSQAEGGPGPDERDVAPGVGGEGAGGDGDGGEGSLGPDASSDVLRCMGREE